MRINIRVIPNAKKDEVLEDTKTGVLVVRVKAKPDDNKANIAVIRLLESISGRKVRIVSGFKSRRKAVEIL